MYPDLLLVVVFGRDNSCLSVRLEPESRRNGRHAKPHFATTEHSERNISVTREYPISASLPDRARAAELRAWDDRDRDRHQGACGRRLTDNSYLIAYVYKTLILQQRL